MFHSIFGNLTDAYAPNNILLNRERYDVACIVPTYIVYVAMLHVSIGVSVSIKIRIKRMLMSVQRLHSSAQRLLKINT